MDKNSKWMAISGIAGLAFFLIANYTNLFEGSSVLTGCLQLCINAFVLVTWKKKFDQSTGWKKIGASFGVFVPVVMANVTLCRVLIPAIIP